MSDSVVVEYSARDTLHAAATVGATLELETSEQVITTIREYDTSRSADTATGTPPLLREVTQQRFITTVQRQSQTVAQTLDQARAQELQASRQRDSTTRTEQSERAGSQTTVEEHTTERRGMNPVQQVLCCIGLAVIVVAAIWLFKRFYKRFNII